MNKKEVVVIIPIYKNSLDRYENTSLDFCERQLNEHSVIVVSPKSLSSDKTFIDLIKQKKIKVYYFDNKFFEGIGGYNRLMLSSCFYKAFSDYEFMLIYQLDALVFSDDLLTWTKKDYDYIGAPWLCGEGHNIAFDSSGNGGFSLRKIKSFISVLESRSFFYDQSKCRGISFFSGLRYQILIKIMFKMSDYKISLNFVKIFLYLFNDNEDLFWTYYAKFFVKDFVLPTIKESLKFSFEENPSFCFYCNNRKIPFGAHAWHKYDLSFWLDRINGLKENLSKY